VADAFARLADEVQRIAPPVVMEDCTARLFDALDAALGR
jgi:hypothetical protein